jgi:hypothetical protein
VHAAAVSAAEGVGDQRRSLGSSALACGPSWSDQQRTVGENVWPWSWAMCPTRLDIPSVIGVCTTRLGRRRGPAPEHDRMAVVLPAPSGPTNPNACPSPRLNDRPSRATRARPGGSVSGIPTRRPTHSGSHPDVRGLTRTLAAGPVGGVRPGRNPGSSSGRTGSDYHRRRSPPWTRPEPPAPHLTVWTHTHQTTGRSPFPLLSSQIHQPSMPTTCETRARPTAQWRFT